MRHAIVDGDDIVQSVIEWDGKTEWEPPEDTKVYEVAGDLVVNPGWRWNDGKPVDPNPVVADAASAAVETVPFDPPITIDEIMDALITKEINKDDGLWQVLAKRRMAQKKG